MREPNWRRRAARVVWDCSSWLMATLFVVAARYDFHLNASQYRALTIYVVVACVMQVLVGTALMLYRGRYRTAGFDETSGLVLTVAMVSAALAVVVVFIIGVQAFPRATAVIVPPIGLVCMAGARAAYRQGLLDNLDMVLADIRDEETVARLSALHRPEVFFHAAALKHLPLLEQYQPDHSEYHTLDSSELPGAQVVIDGRRLLDSSGLSSLKYLAVRQG